MKRFILKNSKEEFAFRGEVGAVIPLVAVLLGVILASVALAIDLSIFSSQHEKYKRVAEQASLAALEEYLQAIGRDKKTEVQALDAAIGRAEEISGINLELHFSTAFRKDSTKPLAELDVSGGPNGTVVPGNWYFEDTDDDPCDVDGTFKPCFEQVAADERATALRVELSVAEGSPLKVLFSYVVQSVHRTFTVKSTATMIPRRGVFLLDLSRSITRDTHLAEDHPTIDQIKAAEYAFYVEPGATCSSDFWKWWDAVEARDKITFDNLDPFCFSGGWGWGGSTSSCFDDPRVHYRLDYRCFEQPDSGEFYGIDIKGRPEPLSSVLDGIHTALQEFEARSVQSDLVGLLAFDDEILEERQLAIGVPDSVTNPEFAEFLSATDTSLDITQRLDHYLFPRFFGGKTLTIETADDGVISEPSPAMTDLRMALEEARDMITDESGWEFSDNFVVLFTDGLSNCPGTPFTGQRWPCSDEDEYVLKAVPELDAVVNDYREKGIAIHIFLTGDNVGPHLLLRKVGDGAGSVGGCMTDDAARANPGTPIVMVDHAGGSYESPPFYFPNRLYEAAVNTGGLWSPNVNCCQADGICADINSTLDDACDADPGSSSAVITSVTQPTISDWVDTKGRLGCNAKGKTKSEQVADGIRRIMDKNPFLLVE